ncbi:MAG: prepilin-type N-terminal cleavage/methylation domain-containing protein [Clostridiales Family XIII bacterium]|jgi:prepilin-type N-terminal cleavage/methylation domain-containing protein|nr:prepilin-type N-terminal cleavage/methylation domain-containing protein [Clostridiales Family XIII bacterium]
MNMTPKKRLVNRRGRKGFTLVEVIVVLVILAILAAIAIPALTGYIDKAQWMKLKSMMNTYRTAVQTMIIEEVTDNGGTIPIYNGNTGDNGGYFQDVRNTDYNGHPIYTFLRLSSKGKAELEKLTGDSELMKYLGDASVNCEADLTVKQCQLSRVASSYLPTATSAHILMCIWLADLPATDIYMEYFSNQIATASDKTTWSYKIGSQMTSGFNAFDITRKTSGNWEWIDAEKIHP